MVYPIEIKWESEEDATKQVQEFAKVVCGMPVIKILYYFFWARTERWGDAARQAADRNDVLVGILLLVPTVFYLVPFYVLGLVILCQQRLRAFFLCAR